MEDGKASAVAPRRESNVYIWYVVGVCFVAYTVNFIDRQILAILLSPIKEELDLKDVHLGLLSGTAFGIFYATMGIPIGRLADRYPRRTVMAISVALWSTMTALSGAARGFYTLLVCRIGVGIGEAGCSPPAISLISDYVPQEKRGRALSLYSMGVPVGIVIGFLAGGYLREIVGWRMAFVVVGLPGIVVALLLLLTVREPLRTTQNNLPPLGEVMRFLWQRRSFRFLAIASGLYAFALTSTMFMLALFLERSHGLGAIEQGHAAAFIMAGGVGIGTLAGGFIADAWAKHDRRAYALLPMISMAIAVPGSAAAFLCDNTPIAIGLLMIPGLCGHHARDCGGSAVLRDQYHRPHVRAGNHRLHQRPVEPHLRRRIPTLRAAQRERGVLRPRLVFLLDVEPDDARRLRLRGLTV